MLTMTSKLSWCTGVKSMLVRAKTTLQNGNPKAGDFVVLNKTIIALTAATVLASASAALASEEPENKIGDRYPFLEQVYRANSPSRATSERMSAPRSLKPVWAFRLNQFSSANQYINDAPENKIGDRYPLLEPKVQSQRTRGHVTAGQRHKKSMKRAT